MVVGLIMMDADGSNRRTLTEDGFLEFDVTYAPDGQRLAFARADADSGRGLGIWERPLAGDAAAIELPPDSVETQSPAGSGGATDAPSWLRAPRYSADGEALAFVDPTGFVGIVELATDSVTRVRYEAHAPPAWRSDGSAILVTGQAAQRTREVPDLVAPIGPLEPGSGTRVGLLERSGTGVVATAFGEGARMAAVASDGRIAYLGQGGSLRITDAASRQGTALAQLDGERVGAAAFAPGEDAIVASEAVRAAVGRAKPSSPSPRDAADRLKAAAEGRMLEDPAAVREAVVKAGDSAPLPLLRALVDRLRQQEASEPAARRAEWIVVRAAAHAALARRGSRLALYDVREALESATGPLPVEFLTALSVLGDVSCLEAIAAAFARTTRIGPAGDDWWRRHLLGAFRAIVARERLTQRHAVMRKIFKKWPDIVATRD